MEIARKSMAGVQSLVELLMNQWRDLDRHLDDLVLVSEKKGEDQIPSNLRDLEEKEKGIALREKEFEVRERERQEAFEGKNKALDRRDLGISLIEPSLSIREDDVRSQQEEMEKRKSEVFLGEKKMKDLEQMLEVKTRMFERKKKHSVAYQGLELGESSGQKRRRGAQPSGSVSLRI